MTVDPHDSDRPATAEIQRQRAFRSKCDRVNAVMRTYHGRAVLWDLMERLGPFRSSFDPGNERMSAYNAGRKDFGLEVFQELSLICPELVQTMQREAHARSISPDASRPHDAEAA